MDDMKARTFMRGETKNARAEQLLALLKAEREINELELKEIPDSLKKRPLLPAIRQTSTGENSIHSENNTEHFSAGTVKSKFLWKDLDWPDEDRSRGNKDRRGSLIRQKDYWLNSTENSGKSLPPLKTKRRHSQGIIRPGCPEPPETPSFD